MFRSIKIKIMLSIMLSSAFAVCIITGMMIISQRTNNIKEAKEKIKSYSHAFGADMEYETIKIETTVAMMQKMTSALFDYNKYKNDPDYFENVFEPSIKKPFKQIVSESKLTASTYFSLNIEVNNPNKENLLSEVYYTTDDDGEVIRGGTTSVDDYSDSKDPEMNWYYTPVSQKKSLWTSPSQEEDGNYYISYTKPVMYNDSVLGVVGIDMEFTTIIKLMDDMELYNEGFAFLLDESCNVYANTSNEKKLEDLSDQEKKSLYNLAKLTSMGVDTVKMKGKNVLVGYSMLDSGHVLITKVDEDDMLSSLYKSINRAAMIAILCLLGCAILSIVISGQLSRPLRKLSIHLAIVSKGDFSQELNRKLLKRKDEIGKLSNSIRFMEQSIGELVKGIIEDSKSLSKAMEASNDNISNLTTNVTGINDSTIQLAASMEEVSTSVSSVDTSSSTISKETELLVRLSTDNKELVSEMSTRAKNLVETTEESNKTTLNVFSRSNQKMKEALQESEAVAVGQVSLLLQDIVNIIDQIDLLALNASIEAAHAGEHGKGFAIVANQVKKLAIDSQMTIKKIQEVTKTINSSVANLQTEATALLEFIDTRVIKDYDSLLETSKLYNNDAMMVERVFYSFDKSASEMLQSILHISDSMNQIATVTEECAENTSDIAVKTEGVHEESMDISSQMEVVNKSADHLRSMVSNFKV